MHKFLMQLTLVMVGLTGLPAGAQAQEWLLNPTASRFYMQTVKAAGVFENHQFTGLTGTVTANGDANVKIDLTSVASGIDVRDVRMRFILFETFKFPNAEVTTKLDMNALRAVMTSSRIEYPLKLNVKLHGFEKSIDAPVNVSKISQNSVSVATAKPIIVPADSFGFTAGIAKLSEAVGGTPIANGATFTFDLVFETGEKIPEIRAAQSAAVQRKIEVESATITADACETRFSVISTTRSIFFRTGSAELDPESEPLLNSVADIASRCPGVRIEVAGHTDSVGHRQANQRLSEQRAQSVADYMSRQRVERGRVVTAGFGDSQPVAPNDSESNRAKNRRIEFKVLLR
ncbi:MAG: ompa/motb domain protein [Xanthobacteraceae bacterium]|nr:ompa/motb domain protein [Xanthobacteraceae bacterium]